MAAKKKTVAVTEAPIGERYDELKRMLIERQREIMAQVKGKIREVRAEGMPQAFLDGFKGKGHDDKFQIGGDLKSGGADEATATSVSAAIRQDAVIMQTLYGGKHSH